MSSTPPPVPPQPSLLTDLHSIAKPKPRSSATHETAHAPLLAQSLPVTCLLLGDSMFERFQTTGHATRFGPSRAPFPEFLNAGVGGDRVCHVAYRLADKGLLSALQTAGVGCALLQMGTNDLVGDKRPLSEEVVDEYATVVRALQWACPGVRVLVCGLNPKSRAREGVVEESNERLQRMVRELKAAAPECVVEYMPSNPEIINHLEDDGVHLNEQGYELFSESLWHHYQMIVREQPQ